MNTTTIEINGETYIKQQQQRGTRAVVVVDRGWIFAGDVERVDGRILLTRAVHVFGFREIGFPAAIANPDDERVDIRPMPEGVSIPESAEIFCIPVHQNWGL